MKERDWERSAERIDEGGGDTERLSEAEKREKSDGDALIGEGEAIHSLVVFNTS